MKQILIVILSVLISRTCCFLLKNDLVLRPWKSSKKVITKPIDCVYFLASNDLELRLRTEIRLTEYLEPEPKTNSFAHYAIVTAEQCTMELRASEPDSRWVKALVMTGPTVCSFDDTYRISKQQCALLGMPKGVTHACWVQVKRSAGKGFKLENAQCKKLAELG